MITRTPPREGPAPSRKRNRHNDPFAAPFPSSHNTSAAVGAAGLARHVFDTKTTSLFSPSHLRICNSVASGAGAAAAAATVSPFIDRRTKSTAHHHNSNNVFFPSPLFALEPVQEEINVDNGNSFGLSQSSIASSLTFGSNGGAASESSARMDCWSGGSVGDFYGESGSGDNRSMIGNMVGSTVDTVVGCSVGGGPSSISSNSHINDSSIGSHQPLTKRARLDYGGQMIPQSMEEDNVMTHSPTAASTEKTGPNCINFKTNIDKSDGKLCCHVCSVEDGANHKDDSRVATTTSPYSHQRCSPAAPIAVTSAPRSHSLLAYFQPTKKQLASPHHQPPRFHRRREASPHNAPSNLSQCRYCDKPTCSTCTRQCVRCHHHFCTFCTKVDYDSSVAEQIMCFECDDNGDDGDCEMMDL